jgi:hypothetical protein
MNSSKLRRRIAFEAARLMYSRQESEYYRAKMKAARFCFSGWVKPADLPSNAEIRDELQSMARLYEGDQRTDNLLEMRVDALRLMRILRRFRPRLIGSVLTGHIRTGSDIDLHVFADGLDAVTIELDDEGLVYDVERKRVRKNNEERIFTHIHIQDRFPCELTVYASNKAHFVFKSSITGKAIERASISELEAFMQAEYPDLNVDDEVADSIDRIDRFQLYESLLLPLENVEQGKKYHPEGDALYHSLQVFDLARDELPYDEEFLLAALLHDVGKGIDRDNHVAAGLEALGSYVTERTGWMIANHMLAQKVLDGTIGSRARKRLRANQSHDEILLLAQCDRDGRVAGAMAPDLDEALDYVRDLVTMFG